MSKIANKQKALYGIANIIVNKINVVINPLQPRISVKKVSNEICAPKSFEHQSFCNVNN